MENITECKTYLSQERIIGSLDFIQKHNLRLRTQDEISKKYKEVTDEECFFEFRKEVLLDYLSFENAKPYLNKSYVEEVESGKKVWDIITNIEETLQDFLDYMNFAWGKAEDERGISATRSVQKLEMWLWLLGREDLAKIIRDDSLYNPYGAPALIAVCNKLDIKVPKSLIEFSKNKC